MCEGRGEIITKLPDTLSLNAVIAISGERVSTPSAYSKLDVLYADFDGSIKTAGAGTFDRLSEGILCGRICGDCLYNVFEDAVLSDCKGAAALKERLLSLGADAALMSGSGPSVFGLFGTQDAAKRAADILTKDGIKAFAVRSV